jgi:hypothetical protein
MASPLHEREAVGVVRPERQGLGVDHVHGVVRAVDVEVEPRDDEVLVVRRVRAALDERAKRRLAVGERGGDHDPGRPHLTLDVAVLVEAPVDEVLVVGHEVLEQRTARSAQVLRSRP